MSFVKAFVAALALSTASVDALRPSLHGRAHSNWRHHNTVRPRATTYTLKDKFDSSNILECVPRSRLYFRFTDASRQRVRLLA